MAYSWLINMVGNSNKRFNITAQDNALKCILKYQFWDEVTYITWKLQKSGLYSAHQNKSGKIERVTKQQLIKDFFAYMKYYFPKITYTPKLVTRAIRLPHQCALCGWTIHPTFKPNDPSNECVVIQSCEKGQGYKHLGQYQVHAPVIGCNCMRKVYHRNCGETRLNGLTIALTKIYTETFRLYKKIRSSTYYHKNYGNRSEYSKQVGYLKEEFHYNMTRATGGYCAYTRNSGLNCNHNDILTDVVINGSSRVPNDLAGNSSYRHRLRQDSRPHCVNPQCWCNEKGQGLHRLYERNT